MDSPSPPSKRRRKNECGDDTSSSPVVVFAHGAGAPSSSDWMIKSNTYSFSLFFLSSGTLLFVLFSLIIVSYVYFYFFSIELNLNFV